MNIRYFRYPPPSWHLYYFSDLSLGEISEETGITRQAAFNCIKKCEERLTELEKALGLLKKARGSKKGA